MIITESDAIRFWSKVDRSGNCWEWTAGRFACGYGQFGLGGRSGRPHYSHRVSWTLENGPIPEGKIICHHCDNRKCVRPDHLFIGTHKDNMHDMYAKGRDGTRQKPRPHRKLTDIEVFAIRDDQRLHKDIAKDYAVSISLISGIKSGKRRQYI